MRSCGMAAFFAAGLATESAEAAVIKTFAFDVFKAYVISSTLYAGEAPEIIPPVT